MNTKTIPLVFTIISLVIGGCAWLNKPVTVDPAKAARIKTLCTGAAEEGGKALLAELPNSRPKIQTAYDRLDQLIRDKAVTGDLIREILNTLPVKELKSPLAVLGIGLSLVVYDATVGDQINLNNSPYAMAAGEGIRDGLGRALAQ